MTRALLLALIPACTALDDGAAGKPADCSRDPVCRAVQDALEIVRGNIGGKSGTPDNIAMLDILEIGPPAIQHLARALSDPRPEVAGFSALRIIDLGDRDRVDAWCAASSHPECPEVRAYADTLVDLDPVGAWTGYRNIIRDEDADMLEQTATLRLRRTGKRLGGELCLEPHGCLPLTRAEFAGARVALDYAVPGGRETMTLFFEDGDLLGRSTVVGCPTCVVGVELTRQP